MSGAPFVAGSDTSKKAAGEVQGRVVLQRQVFKLVEAAGIAGLTCSQVELAIPQKTHQSLSARLRELVLDGKIIDSGERRQGHSGRTQRVYILKPSSTKTGN